MLNAVIEDYGLQRFSLLGLLHKNEISREAYDSLYSKVIFNKRDIFSSYYDEEATINSDDITYNLDDVTNNQYALVGLNKKEYSDFKENNTSNEGEYNYYYDLIEKSRIYQAKIDSSLSKLNTIEVEFKTSKFLQDQKELTHSNKEEKGTLYDESTSNNPLYEVKLNINNLKTIETKKGTSLLYIAFRYKIDFSKLLEYNDLPSQSNLTTNDQFIYLEQKKKQGNRDYHIVKGKETIYDISQIEGVYIRNLREYNFLPVGFEPNEGEKIFLMYSAPVRPLAYIKNN